MAIEWRFGSIRERLDRLEQLTSIRQTDHGVEIVDRRTGEVIRVMGTTELLVWWERLANHVDSVVPPSFHAD